MLEVNCEAIELRCDCNTRHRLEIVKYDWDDGQTEYELGFVVSAYYCDQSLIGIIKTRLKFAWQALRKGNYLHNVIMTRKEALSEFNKKLTEMLEEKK